MSTEDKRYPFQHRGENFTLIEVLGQVFSIADTGEGRPPPTNAGWRIEDAEGKEACPFYEYASDDKEKLIARAKEELGMAIPKPILPLHLQTYDRLGLDPPEYDESPNAKVLAALYGLSQLLCDGMPDLRGRIADGVIAGLVRDAAVAIGAGIVLLKRRLYEPTVRLARSLHEARLCVQRIRTGESEKLANLLIADRLHSKKRQLEREIELGLREPNEESTRHARTIKRIFREDDALRGALVELKDLKQRGLEWHGASGIEGLAKDLDDQSSYQLLYVPASGFVHPGDPDVHVREIRGVVSLKDIVCDDPTLLAGAASYLVTEGYELLTYAVQPWKIGPEIEVALSKAMPVMIVALAGEPQTPAEIMELEQMSGLPQPEWINALRITFDWDDPDNGGNNRRT